MSLTTIMPENKLSTPSSLSLLPQFSSQSFGISPLIRITLLLLYVALTLPLPALATVTEAPVSARWLQVGIVVGGILLYGGLSERVFVDA